MKFKKFITALIVTGCIASCAPQPAYAGGFSSRSTELVPQTVC